MSARRFEGKVAFITGAGSGIGEAAARRFAREGAQVAVVDIVTQNARRVAADCGGLAIGIDVSDEQAVAGAFAQTLARFGRVDVIFNNAGITGVLHPLHEMPVDNWQRVDDVNGRGMFLVMKHGLAALLKTGGGAIVNTASISSFVTSGPNIGAYAYTKSGILGLTRAAACDYATRNIRVNAVAPGQVLTPLVERLIAEAPDPEAERRHRANRHVMPGFIEPDDIAAAVAFLASDEARWITGITLPVDGGYTAR